MNWVKKPGDQADSRVKQQATGNSKVVLDQVQLCCPGIYTDEVEGQLTPAGHSGDMKWAEYYALLQTSGYPG